jgi:AcrR family transcriptional regulator
MSEKNPKKNSSPKELRKRREKQRRRENIISAAEKIFSSEGFKETNMDQVANDAGFSKATIYQYFNSKEDLYLAICVKAYQKLNSLLQKREDQLGSKFLFSSTSNVLMELVIEYPFYSELFNAKFIRKKLAEIHQKRKNKQKLTQSECEFFEADITSSNFIFKALNNNLRESGEEVDKTIINSMAEALGSITTGLINELLFRHKYFGLDEKGIKEILDFITRLIDFGIQNYTEIIP